MALLIDLERREYVDPRKELDIRKRVALHALNQYLRGYFEPTDIEIWETAPLSELGGLKISSSSINIGDIYQLEDNIDKKTRELRYQSLFESIIRINGVWKLDGIEKKGFFSINNAPLWRRAYGDVDIDIYPDGREDDITVLFWNDNILRERLVDNFFEGFVRDFYRYKLAEKMNLNWICFASGIPTKRDVTTIKAVYYSSLKSFVSDSFQTFRDANVWVQRSLSLKYLVNRAYEEDEFKKTILKTLEGFHINKIDGNSVILIGEHINSFNKLYAQFSDEYLEPIFNKLTPDDKVNDIVKEVVTKQERLKGI